MALTVSERKIGSQRDTSGSHAALGSEWLRLRGGSQYHIETAARHDTVAEEYRALMKEQASASLGYVPDVNMLTLWPRVNSQRQHRNRTHR
jgi:hypothetical protein